jgi:hypothetical protein
MVKFINCSQCNKKIGVNNNIYRCEQCTSIICTACVEDANETIEICKRCRLDFSYCQCPLVSDAVTKVLCNACTDPQPNQDDVIKFILARADFRDMEEAKQAYIHHNDIRLFPCSFKFRKDHSFTILEGDEDDYESSNDDGNDANNNNTDDDNIDSKDDHEVDNPDNDDTSTVNSQTDEANKPSTKRKINFISNIDTNKKTKIS